MRVVSKAFEAVRPGDVYPSTVEAGEAVEGVLLDIAEALGCVEPVAPPAPPAPPVPAAEPPKAKRGRPVAAPETKG